MKKILMGCLGIFLLVIGALNVKAAKFIEDGANSYKSDSAISFGAYGSFAAGDWKYTVDDAQQTKNFTLALTPSSVLKANSYIYFTIVPTVGLEITNSSDISVNTTNFVISSITKVEEGYQVLVQVIRDVPTQSTSFLTVNAKVIDKENCEMSISPMKLSCSVIDTNHFDKNGNLVTEEEYDSLCNGVVTPPNDVESPDTGNPIPYIAIGGGLVAIALVFLYSRKSNKVYKL